MIVVLCFSATFVIRQVSVGMVSFTCLQHLGFILGLLDGVSLASARRTSFHDTWKSKGRSSSSSKLEFFSRVVVVVVKGLKNIIIQVDSQVVKGDNVGCASLRSGSL